MNFNPQNLNALLSVVSKKLGVSPDTLKNELENGKFDRALNSMKPTEAAKFQQIVNNPKLVDAFMSTPQAKDLYSKLTK